MLHYVSSVPSKRLSVILRVILPADRHAIASNQSTPRRKRGLRLAPKSIAYVIDFAGTSLYREVTSEGPQWSPGPHPASTDIPEMLGPARMITGMVYGFMRLGRQHPRLPSLRMLFKLDP